MPRNLELANLEKEISSLENLISYTKRDNELIKLRIKKKKLIIQKLELQKLLNS